MALQSTVHNIYPTDHLNKKSETTTFLSVDHLVFNHILFYGVILIAMVCAIHKPV